MTPTLSIGVPYYRNPTMLVEQFRVWASYADDLKAQIEIVLVDDGSPVEQAMNVPRPDGLPSLRLYRVLVDIPWHQHGARNLAAKEAQGEWLFLTDMDHVLPETSLRKCVELMPSVPVNAACTFYRLDAPKLTTTVNERGEPKRHPNTFLMRRDHFWTVGGYDEDCVGYGTDGYFRKRLYAQSTEIHLANVPIIRYPREVIADANTRPEQPMDPREFRNRSRQTGETKRRLSAKDTDTPKVLDFPWERVL